LAQKGAARQIGRLTTAQLQRYRMFFSIESQVPLHVTMQQGSSRNHLCV
jgi:imidazoleglycerol phosphate dehydratase HisB